MLYVLCSLVLMRTHFVKMEVALNRFSILLGHIVMWLVKAGHALQVQVCLEPRTPKC